MALSPLDIAVFVAYCIGLVALALWLMNFSYYGFNQAAIGIVIILTALYTTWW